jgi:2-oxoglutarate dehydrogenase E2 component (dihydrolipoamide succinyltransferase)
MLSRVAPTIEAQTIDIKEDNPPVIVSQKTNFAEPINSSRFYSPLVLTIATSEGISMSELEKLPGTGMDGRVTKKDILEYVQGRTGNLPKTRIQQPAPPPPAQAPLPKPSKEIDVPPVVAPGQFHVTPDSSVEIIEMDRMRKLISQHMVHSKHTSPHVTSFSEADVTNLVLWREKVKASYEKSHGEKITLTPLFIEAIVKCIQKFPLINSSVDGDRIIVKKNINIGMATALPNGNLIVPVIKHSEELNIIGLTKQVNFLANAARNNKLRPDDTSGGTFTFTNVGVFGSLMGTPIISQPQVAIIAVGAIKKRPVVVESEFGDTIAIRHMMYLSMSYDHRIIDGALGASFLTAVAKELESFDPNRTV